MENRFTRVYNFKNDEARCAMLFRKDIEPCCSYCEKGSLISETEVRCKKRGVVSAAGSCSAFRYDPLKREPPRPAKLHAEKYSEEDFKL